MDSDVEAKTIPGLLLDEVLEQIFLHLDTRSLLACRLVSRQWRSAATSQLRKKIQIHLHNFKLASPDSNKNSQDDKVLDDLSNILVQSEAFNFLFPCNNFSFTQTVPGNPEANFSNAGFQNFLYRHGPRHIKKLSLSFRGIRTIEGYDCPHESVVMEQVQNLLLNQTPNLNSLTLNIDSDIKWKNKNNPDWINWMLKDPLQVTDEEYHEIHQKILSLPQSSRNTSLKVFKLVGEMPAKVFEIVILLCPNLQEVVFVDKGFLPFIIEPVNRFRLLKTLNFDLCPGYFETIAKIASALQNQQAELKLREFTIRFVDYEINHAQLLCSIDPQFRHRVVSVLNEILESSADSLETFVWHGMIYLNGLKLPLCLPNITRLELSTLRSGKQIQPFPTDFFSLSTTFPKLRHVSLHWNSENGFKNFLHLFNPEGSLQVLSVKCVNIIFNKYSSRQDLSAENLQLVRDVFPNALVRNIYGE